MKNILVVLSIIITSAAISQTAYAEREGYSYVYSYYSGTPKGYKKRMKVYFVSNVKYGGEYEHKDFNNVFSDKRRTSYPWASGVMSDRSFLHKSKKDAEAERQERINEHQRDGHKIKYISIGH